MNPYKYLQYIDTQVDVFTAFTTKWKVKTYKLKTSAWVSLVTN